MPIVDYSQFTLEELVDALRKTIKNNPVHQIKSQVEDIKSTFNQKFGALLALILMSISVNAFLFHAVLDPGGIGGSVVLLLLNIIVLFGYKDKYKDLLS